ncbi:MAG: hypothetical protein COX52_10905 [Syntrophobacterales bacterium CG23_combo_of_CG06-09_8_20_14_all_48_27]|nr:MAG: hypothetical protein COX52_10905 [Syntrophobacterales bacterium CG23_combo_of_CG06-09_8_20_14_all_48_27]
MEIEIPYRLDNPEAIEQAMRQNLFKLGDAYDYLLKVASALPLEHPPAFLHAREVVKKDFQIFMQEKMEHLDFGNYSATKAQRPKEKMDIN